MIVTAMQCEMCPKTHQLGGRDIRLIPEGWLAIVEAYKEDYHFCSRECLARWIGGGSTQPLPDPVDTPATKMRRFLLVDGETAEEHEGVMWSDGMVTRREDGMLPVSSCIFPVSSCISWENFKEHHPGCGVIWIDQEIREEVPA